MIIYLLWFLVAVGIYLYAEQRKMNPKNETTLAVFLFLLALFIGCSDMLGGYDRYIYSEVFDAMADEQDAGRNPFDSWAFSFYGTEFGYGTYNVLLAFLTSNRYVFILITTFLIYVLLFVSIRDYTSNYPLAVILFMGLWMFFTFTYLRQVLGATIAWLSIRYVVSRQFGRFLLVWLVAYGFHNSALVFLPLYFVPVKVFPKKKVLGFMFFCLLVGLTPLPFTLFETYGEAAVDRVGVDSYVRDNGFRIEYVVEVAFFLYVILSRYKRIPLRPKDIVLLNMSLVFCAILLVFNRSENGGRLAWYYMIGAIATLTNVAAFKEKALAMNRMLLVVSFLLYFRIVYAWGGLLSPYKTFFTNGIRKGDYIYEKYEYNTNYTRDKFCREAIKF